jgi:hypothetical protein
VRRNFSRANGSTPIYGRGSSGSSAATGTRSGNTTCRSEPCSGLRLVEAQELQKAWQRYCEVIAELERATAAI